MTAEDARIRTGTALALLELAAEVLDQLPAPGIAFGPGDRELYRNLQAAEAARSWLVGHEVGDDVEHPARGSALGDGQRTFHWSDEDTERHFTVALQDRGE